MRASFTSTDRIYTEDLKLKPSLSLPSVLHPGRQPCHCLRMWGFDSLQLSCCSSFALQKIELFLPLDLHVLDRGLQISVSLLKFRSEVTKRNEKSCPTHRSVDFPSVDMDYCRYLCNFDIHARSLSRSMGNNRFLQPLGTILLVCHATQYMPPFYDKFTSIDRKH